MKVLYCFSLVLFLVIYESPQAFSSPLQQRIAAESQAWADIKQHDQKDCLMRFDAAKRDNALQFVICLNIAIEAKVLPVTPVEFLVEKLESNFEKAALEFSEGDISERKFREEMLEAVDIYNKERGYIIRQSMNVDNQYQNEQQPNSDDAIRIIDDSFQNQSTPPPPPMPLPTHTSCQALGHGMWNCDTH